MRRRVNMEAHNVSRQVNRTDCNTAVYGGLMLVRSAVLRNWGDLYKSMRPMTFSGGLLSLRVFGRLVKCRVLSGVLDYG